MAKIIADNLYLCFDCTIADCNGDYSGMNDDRAEEVRSGLARLTAREGGHLAPNFDSNTGEGVHEFSKRPCDACRTHLVGYQARYTVLA